MITECSRVATMVTDRAQHWHLAVTCNITVAMVKTIVIVASLSYQITQNYFQGFEIYKRLVKTAQIAYSSSFRTQFGVSHATYLPISQQERPRVFLPRLLTAVSRIQNGTPRKAIMYQTSSRTCPLIHRGPFLPCDLALWPCESNSFNITSFVFDRCCRSLAKVTPVKYEHDWINFIIS